MNIVVLIKQVPDTAQLSSSMDGLKLLSSGPKVINPWDEYAIETALQLMETHRGSKVTLLSMGKPEAVEALKTGLAMGASEAILLSDKAMVNSDSLATARILATAIKKTGSFDMIITGRSAIDGNSAATGVQVAALLGIPHISYVAKLEAVDPDSGKITAIRLRDKGREIISGPLPVAISVVKEINEPRYPSLIGIRKAARAKIPTWNLADLGLTAEQVGSTGSQVKWSKVMLPPTRDASVEMIEGPPAEVAQILVERLKAEKVI